MSNGPRVVVLLTDAEEPPISEEDPEPSTSRQDPEPSTSTQVLGPSTSEEVPGSSTSKQVPEIPQPTFKLSPATKLLLSDRLNSILTGKRKASIDDYVSPSEKRFRMETMSKLESVTTEARKLKIDLIATKAQVVALESHANRQRTKHMETQILFEAEKSSLIAQHKSDERAVSNMADRLQMIGRRERDLMNDYEQEKREHMHYKEKWDKEKSELYRKLAETKDNLLECSSSSQQQMSEMRRDMDELLQGLESSQSEVQILKAEVENLTERAKYCTTLRTQLEKQNFELQVVTMKLRDLQYEKDSHLDWQRQAKTAERRLINMAALEKEVARLRAQEKNIRDCIVNKLLLEEQVHVLETKVKVIQPMQDKLHETTVKVASLEMDLGQWKAAASPHGIETPNSLSTTLETVLKNQLEATVESSEAQLQLAAVTEEWETVKFERNKANGKVKELLTVRKYHEGLINRLQKKQQLISRDRDSYIQLLQSYEKELAMIEKGEQNSDSLELLKTRIEQQEQSLQRYRDLLIKLDPTEQTKLVDSLRTESNKRREENEFLNREVERLRRHRNSLLLKLERIGSLS